MGAAPEEMVAFTYGDRVMVGQNSESITFGVLRGGESNGDIHFFLTRLEHCKKSIFFVKSANIDLLIGSK